jgi:hypothetical protein
MLAHALIFASPMPPLSDVYQPEPQPRTPADLERIRLAEEKRARKKAKRLAEIEKSPRGA